MLPQFAAAQPGLPVGPDTLRVTIAAGKRYEAGALHRWFGGNTYRDLWTMPIRVPVLDLATYAGGIHPTKLGGGMQTLSLRFEDAAGSAYVFRLSDKSIGGAPTGFNVTPVARVFQDEVSALHPGAAQIAAPIVDASGVLHPTAVLMVMPDDPALGEFRAQFAGRLGMVEQFPNMPDHGPGFGGASKIIDSEELLHLLDADPAQHIDARAFLIARLTDFLINDNDRHLGNWKWARLASGPKTEWQPIARDRDHAFVAYDGIVLSIARKFSPLLVSFGDTPDVEGLTRWRGFDGRLLSGLGKAAWDSVASALEARVTDSVIHAAAMSMPFEYQSTAPALEATLRNRRAALAGAASEYYHILAARVVVHGTDAPDRAAITRVDDRFVDVRLESQGHAFYARRFDARETSEIVVYLHDGNDSAVVTGHVGRSLRVRVVGGNGTNAFVDSSTVGGHRNPTAFYDRGTVAGISYGLDTLFDRRPWEQKGDSLVPPLADHGSRFEPIVGLSFRRGIGIAPQLGVARYTYGFARRPYSSMVRLSGEYGVALGGVRIGLLVDKRFAQSPLHVAALARVSDFEVIHFGGLGNATPDSGPAKNYFDVRQKQWMVHPALALALGANTDVSIGPVFQRVVTDSVRSPYVSAAGSYGAGTFDEAGVQFVARYERRSVRPGAEHTHHRVLLEVSGTLVPAIMDVRRAFEIAALTAGASITLPIPTHPFLVARAGGKKLFGDFPFFEAATIGGEGTTRYMDTERFAGDGSLYASTELRIPVAHFSLVTPLRVGIIGIAEAGRVFVDGSSPTGWHTRSGEGVWIGRGDASSVVTFTRTTEPGHAGIHVRLGLNF
ncbi:MAG TPA: hypothetical protein VE967_00570 [Gemmatimonadaceae bacterium]|nr:hypothetical protein [Gemmatimonadaceae bacterium]